MKYLFISILSLSVLSECGNLSNSNDGKMIDSSKKSKQ